MSKFKVRCTKAEGNRFIVGNVYELDENGRLTDELGRVGNASLTGTFEEWCKDCNWIDYDFEPVPPRHSIHITCTDGKTTHAVKKVDGKIVARSKVVCCPTDEFDFNVGAQLAFNRLVYGTDYHPSEVAFKCKPKQKPEYYSGKVVCVDSAGYCHTVGKTYTVLDGFLIDDSGTKVPYLTGPVTSVDDLNSRSACKFAVLLDE